MMIVPVAWALLVPCQGPGVPPTPFDRILKLEITTEDPVLIDGRGPTVVAEYQVEFSGTLHVWTRSELDLFIRVEDTADASVHAEDDNSGGGSTPYAGFSVAKGDCVAVLVAPPENGDLGALDLYFVAGLESDATLETARTAREGIDEVSRRRGEGEVEAARALVGALVNELLSTTNARHSESISHVLWELGFLAHDLNGLESRHSAWMAVRDHRERTLPTDHPELLDARLSLAGAMREMGDLRAARTLLEAVLAGYERTLPADHPDLLGARRNLAVTMDEMGDLRGARALLEAVLASYERTLPADHRDVLAARRNLAVTMVEMGDLRGARALLELVLAGHERTLPADHPDLLGARRNLAGVMRGMGDLRGARPLLEVVLAGYERTLPVNHPDLLAARANLAIAMHEMGDLRRARALLEATNVGVRRAGQGIQSLQAALYAAGARASITSLWKVDDAATRRLMEIFYKKLWGEKKPKAEALWEAKTVLSEEGAPVMDWAAWVLTGDPE